MLILTYSRAPVSFHFIHLNSGSNTLRCLTKMGRTSAKFCMADISYIVIQCLCLMISVGYLPCVSERRWDDFVRELTDVLALSPIWQKAVMRIRQTPVAIPVYMFCWKPMVTSLQFIQSTATWWIPEQLTFGNVYLIPLYYPSVGLLLLFISLSTGYHPY